ncbi:hypothetical protein RRF57_012904 [Xylaria bambusicola]|uniref:Uncharacterized protein n=1 Tax=Xylaria bambusicola TaxID=326684 RepID=A0AAN7ZB52_9PEZI
MATPVKPAILIVSGGWHVPQSYAKLREALEQAGFEVHIPALASVKPPPGRMSRSWAISHHWVI